MRKMMMMKVVAVTRDNRRLTTITDASRQIISLIKDVH